MSGDRDWLPMKSDWSIPLDDEVADSTGRKCPKCGTVNPLEATFCYLDGERLAKPTLLQPGVPELTEQNKPRKAVYNIEPRDKRRTKTNIKAAADEEINRIKEVGPADDGAFGSIKEAVEEELNRIKVDDFNALREACEKKQWIHVLALAAEARQRGLLLPADLRSCETEAQRRWDCVQRLSNAIEKKSIAEVIAAYDSKLLDDWTDCAEQVRVARKALESWDTLRRLQKLAKNPGSGVALLELWEEHAHSLSLWSESDPIRKAVRDWEARIRAWEILRYQLDALRPSERLIAEAWEKLREEGGHPDANTDKVQQRVGLAARRVACLEGLPPQGRPDSEDRDAQFLQVWDVVLMADCPDAESYKDRYEGACRRLRAVEDLEKVIGQVDRGLQEESAILEAAKKLPGGYDHRRLNRVAMATECVDALACLEAALSARHPSDRDISNAWLRGKQVGLKLPPLKVSRCQLAENRRKRLDQLERIDAGLPLDERDREWLRLWDTQLFRDCADADVHRPVVDAARARVKAWQALAKAINEKDLHNIVNLASSPLLVYYPPLEKASTALQDLLQQAKALRKVEDALAKGNVSELVESLDQEYFRSHLTLLLPHREALQQALKRWLQETATITKTVPVWSEEPHSGLIVIRWTWGYFRQISHCRVAVSPHQFFQSPDETKEQTIHWDAEAHRRAGGGIGIPPFPGKRHLYVTVWPAISLGEGWDEMLGPPLHLGPVKVPSPVRL